MPYHPDLETRLCPMSKLVRDMLAAQAEQLRREGTASGIALATIIEPTVDCWDMGYVLLTHESPEPS